MPELPEVEFTARQLRTAIIGSTIHQAVVFWERTIGYPNLPDFLAQIADRDILDVRRRGKFLVIDLGGELILTIHRRMTGNLLLLPPGWEIDTSLKTSDPIAWNIKGPSFHQTPVGADLSRPSPIYRPSLPLTSNHALFTKSWVSDSAVELSYLYRGQDFISRAFFVGKSFLYPS